MSKPSAIADMMAYAAAEFGQVDVLVNNAGIQHVARIENFPVDKWDAIIAINLSSAFHATRLALPAMQAANGGKGWGRIINVASAHGLVASAEKSAYVASKHAIVGLTKVTALENAKNGVTCNAICPGRGLQPRGQNNPANPPSARNAPVEPLSTPLASETPPCLEFTPPKSLRQLPVFSCPPAGNNGRGLAWNMDGGWVAQ